MTALVALRLALGCHFLYEGVWKIKHRDEFSSEPFLTQAKGPLAPLFYAMVPDLDGRQRLLGEVKSKGESGDNVQRPSLAADAIAARWKEMQERFVDHYRPTAASEAEAAEAHRQLAEKAKRTYERFHKQLDQYMKENVPEIIAHFDALERFQTNKERRQDAPFQKQRHWERMMEFRQEANKWLKDLEAQELAFNNSLCGLLDEEQRAQGPWQAGSWNPFTWTQMEQIDFAVTYGLTAIGICLMLGFCTPLAALGGAAFMCFVVMTQPAFPGIYPPDPPVVGHALLVNKDFVEMMALLTVAGTAAGRWGGLDFFLGRYILRPLLTRRSQKQP